jgi:chaperonin GroEL (HSP60 family)
MIKVGIVQPTRLTRTALPNVASIATKSPTVEVIVVEQP